MKQLELFEKKIVEPVSNWELCVDGAARNNPGPAGAGIYVEKNKESVHMLGYFLGSRTNNQAEYLALVLGLLVVRESFEPQDNILIKSDSELLVRQLLGSYRVKQAELIPLHRVSLTLILEMKAKIKHVPREDNKQADLLANKGIDKQIMIPDDLKQQLKRYEIII